MIPPRKATFSGTLWNTPEYLREDGPKSRHHFRLQSGETSWVWFTAFPQEPCVFLVPDQQRLSAFEQNWRTLGAGALRVLPELPLGEDAGGHSFWIARGEVLRRWKEEGGALLLTPGSFLSPFRFPESYRTLRTGEVFPLSELLAWLQETGHSRVDYVTAPGEYALRGCVLDLFSSSQTMPLRIEYFDDTLESMRYFSPRDQCGIAPVEEILLAGCPSGSGGLISQDAALAFSFFPQETPFVFFDPEALEKQASTYRWLWESLEHARRLPPLPEWEKGLERFGSAPAFFVRPRAFPGDREVPLFDIPSFGGRFQEALAYVQGMLAQGYGVTLYSTHEAARRWGEEQGIAVRKGALTQGCADRESRELLLSDTEMVGLSALEELPRWYASPLERDGGFSPGEYVVHQEYGVALCRGVEEVERDHGVQEYLVLEFAGEKKLYVPFTQIYKISSAPELGAENASLDSLGGRRWKKNLKEARERARKTAQELLQAYVAREKIAGFAFAPGGEIYTRFVEMFPYEETEDQLSVMEDVRRDMEREVPMDRLLVGDVGFGKSEIAFRAAVKAAESGKQTALLVPTTLLAQQHLESFRNRLGDLPLRVEALSRFVSPGRKKVLLEELAQGQIDVLIGTHKMLSRDVKFGDLGLLVVDEEHRFGVAQKERFRWLLPHVDILSLSATPIPRTLHLSLGGLRDISTMLTPPKNRFPVLHVVSPWRDDLVIRALRKELARGGQVFFVHNRVRSIRARAAELQALVPEASVDVAHGRLGEKELEERMERFSSGELDVLVCTSIIESGLDIPKANTLVVDQSHTMGLAQLYQLKGRVGRRDEQAFAYFLYPDSAGLTKEAMDRLEAIGEYNVFGGGAALARKDLEIRGSGELFGVSQHGHLRKVGFSMYCRFLEEEVLALREGSPREEMLCTISLPLGFPSSYIPQASLRVVLYRRAARIETPEKLRAFSRELRDRFGPFPRETERFLLAAELRFLGPRRGIRSVLCEASHIRVEGENLETLFASLPRWMAFRGGWHGPGGHDGLAGLLALLRRGA